MKEKSPHMPWYGREFYADENVLVMTLEQEAAYLRLLWNCWQEGSIPQDEAKLAAICKNMSARKFSKNIWPALRGRFEKTSDGRFVHDKVETLREAKEQRRTVWSEAGKLGNAIRWGNGNGQAGDTNPITGKSPIDRVPDTDPINRRSEIDRVGISVECRVPSVECRVPNVEYQIPKTPCSSDDEHAAGGEVLEFSPSMPKPADEVKVWFDAEFWPAYPRKVARPQGLKAARRHGKTAADRAAIMECLVRRLPALQEQFRPNGDYRPYPSSWLNQTPWLDPPAAERPPGAETPEQRIARMIYGEEQA